MIREANPDDFDAILDMCEVFWGHTGHKEPFDRDHVRKMVEFSHGQGLLLVADDDGIQGFIGAVKAFLLGSTAEKTATEWAWWVNPEKRGKMYGVGLVSALERLCIEQEVKYLNLAFMQSSMPEKVKDLYDKLGYSLEETVYTKVLYGKNHDGDNRGRVNPSGL